MILQYSNDGGVSWNVLGEQLHTQYGKPRYGSTNFCLWGRG